MDFNDIGQLRMIVGKILKTMKFGIKGYAFGKIIRIRIGIGSDIGI